MARVQLTKVFNKTENLGCLHPLGIMYLAAMLRDRQPGKHDIKLHDMILRRETADEALPKILAHDPDVVGLSCMTHEASVMHELAKRIKAARPRTKILVGGPYTEANPEKVLQNRAIDFVVTNEGEFTFEEYMREYEAGVEHPTALGIAYMKGNEYVFTGRREQSDGAALDSIPFPAWDLVDVEAYYDAPRFTPSYARREYMSLFTSRGCPYQCTYCHEMFTKKFHGHSPERTLAEIDAIVEKYGVGELVIVDDIFNIDVPRAKKICDMIVERGYDFRLEFPNGLRADQMTYELLESMKRAGVYRIVYAIETASPRLQKFTKKHVNLNKMKQVIDWTTEMGVFTHGVHMLGFPGETREELEMTVQYACKSNLHTANFFVVNPFDGTELAEQVRAMGIEVNTGDSNNFDYFKNNFELCEMGSVELTRFVRAAHLRFYLHPKRIVRLLWALPNKRMLPRMFVLFLTRSVTYFGSMGERQELLKAMYRLEGMWGKFWAGMFPPKYKQQQIWRQKRKAKELEAKSAAAA